MDTTKKPTSDSISSPYLGYMDYSTDPKGIFVAQPNQGGVNIPRVPPQATTPPVQTPPISTDTTKQAPSSIPDVTMKTTPAGITKTDVKSTPDSSSLPRVTSQSPIATPEITPAKPLSPAEQYLSTFTPSVETEEDIYKRLVEKSSNLISSTKSAYDRGIERVGGQAAAAAAAAGLVGSSAGAGITESAIAPLIEQRTADLAKIYDTINTNAENLYKSQVEMARISASDAIAMEDRAKQTATDAIKTLASNHLDWQNYKQTNPDNYKKLVDSLGGDPNIADAIFANSIPKANIVQSWVNGSTQFQLTQDPVTGKPSIQQYDLGVKVPENWTSEKISNNAVIYHGPNWNPSDPSTYQLFSIDPLTGLPTGQVAGTPNATAPTNPDAVTDAVKNVTSVAGIQDPSVPLKDAIAGQGIDQIIAGIIKNEGSSPVGVVNNPGNIKFAGLPGQVDSGVKAKDGGTFANYSTPENGKKAIADIVNNAASGQSTAYGANPSVSSFINTYTGQTTPKIGGEAVTENNSILKQANISLPVFNYLTQGTSSMARMSAAQRNQIMQQATDFLNKNGLDVSTFQSQYKTYNDVLSSNIQRQQKTQIMEKELIGTVDNLKSVVSDKDLGDVNIANVADIWAGKQVNDPLAARYAFHFQQLKNELAGYFAASQGKNSPDVIDNEDAALAVTNGMSTGSLDGVRKAVEDSTGKMKTVLDSSVDTARKGIWDLFGVGSKYKSQNQSSDIQTLSTQKGFDYQKAKNDGYTDNEIKAFLNQ